MIVRTPAKVIKELEADTEELEHEAEHSDVEETENDDEQMASSDEAYNKFDENETDSDENEDEEDGNSNWADALAKVLKQEKPQNKKYLVLSKVKKLGDKQEKIEDDKKVTFEIAARKSEGDDDNDKDIKLDIDADDSKPTLDELELALITRKERTNKLLELRVKPRAMDREREKGFKRIATKGVVQLFNAVRSQQRDLVDRLEKSGPLDHKRDEVLNNINKRQFLNMLMGGKRAISENVDNPVKDEKDSNVESSRPSQWSVLRDDFMTNKKLKHWDNDEEVDGNEHQDNNNDSVSDSD